MTKEAVFQSSFVGGELSPHMLDRIDMDVYSAGAAHLRNFIPIPHGPLVRRQGTQFLYEAPGPVRLVPFSFTIEQSFMLEFSLGKLRVFYQDSIILNTEGTAPFEVATPWLESDLPNLRWAQYRDWLYIVCGRLQPYVVKRYGNQDWRIETLAYTEMPMEWGGTNWPTNITFFEQRAVYAGTRAQPQQMWFSRTGLPEDFTYNDGYSTTGTTAGQLIILDDHAFTYTIFSTDANGIQWVMPGSTLIVGTSGAEYKVGSTALSDAITPKNIRIVPQTYYGSASIMPVSLSSNIIFVPRSRTRIKSIEYSIQQEQYIATDMTLFSSHILMPGGVQEMVTQTAPDTYIWLLTSAGELVGCTLEPQHKIKAWHKHVTDGIFTAIGILPTAGNDILYLVVKRDDKYFIEIFTNITEPPEDINEAWYVDSGLKYEGAPISSLVGLQHLEGKLVSILVDGWVHEPQIVTGGRITLVEAGSRIQIGLPYTSDFISLAPQSTQKLSVGQTRRMSEIVVAVENSLDFYYKAITEDEYQFAYYGPTFTMNQAKEPSSRHEKLVVESLSAAVQQLQIWQDRPVPLIIRGIVYSINPSGV